MQVLLENDDRLKSVYGLIGLILFVMFFSACGSYLMRAVAYSADIEYAEALRQLKSNNNLKARNLVRTASTVSQVTTFLLPALLIIILLYRKHWKQFLKLGKRPAFALVLLSTFFLFATFPIAQWLFTVNKALPLPTWAVNLEQNLSDLSSGLLVMKSPSELLFNLFTIALIPAIGEELIFRGVIQQKIQLISRNKHFSVWLAAIIFSAFHGQFEGFLPRLLLGAALGYLLIWTNNLWLPIIAHFFNNAIQVTLKYFIDVRPEVGSEPQIPIVLVIVSLILAVILSYLIINFNRQSLVQNRESN